jgi:hypothetical protein
MIFAATSPQFAKIGSALTLFLPLRRRISLIPA